MVASGPPGSRSGQQQARLAAVAAVLVLLALWRASHRREAAPAAVVTAGPTMACPRDLDKWHRMHAKLAAEVAEADAGQGWEVAFMGDSLTERLRGSRAMGLPCKRPQCRGIEAVFAAHVASRFRAGRLGIGGDQTFHLRWRLLNGELPARRHPQLVVLLIGTNDLGAVGARGPAALEAASKDVAARVGELLALLRSRLPSTRVALLALLPRGSPNPPALYSTASACPADEAARAAAIAAESNRLPMEPPTEETFAQPGVFGAAIEATNRRLRALAAATEGVTFVDCAGPLLLRPDGSIDPARMPDALHPNELGYKAIFSECWDGAIADLLGRGGKVFGDPYVKGFDGSTKTYPGKPGQTLNILTSSKYSLVGTLKPVSAPFKFAFFALCVGSGFAQHLFDPPIENALAASGC
ncbi:hypothetical protein ABPG77_009213 [Micractinium sp. CCAP 211/92]